MKYLVLLLLAGCTTVNEQPRIHYKYKCGGVYAPKWHKKRGPCVCENEVWVCRPLN